MQTPGTSCLSQGCSKTHAGSGSTGRCRSQMLGRERLLSAVGRRGAKETSVKKHTSWLHDAACRVACSTSCLYRFVPQSARSTRPPKRVCRVGGRTTTRLPPADSCVRSLVSADLAGQGQGLEVDKSASGATPGLIRHVRHEHLWRGRGCTGCLSAPFGPLARGSPPCLCAPITTHGGCCRATAPSPSIFRRLQGGGRGWSNTWYPGSRHRGQRTGSVTLAAEGCELPGLFRTTLRPGFLLDVA